ncbi:hypothetical protein [Pseudopelagicola sp. nBUS_19]|uniref:hypothetical protein n=1 Tax=Pseudopelagicola sp. nBUS_19 TaxID=3395316 RepID=UPI003EBC88A3
MISFREAAILIEVVDNGCGNEHKFLQVPRPAKAVLGAFPSSKRHVRLLSAIVLPAPTFLSADISSLSSRI